MRSIRRRIFLVLLLVLSQATALVILAGALWFVKVKETMAGKVVLSSSNGGLEASILVPEQDAPKVQQDSIVHVNTSIGSFSARVLRQRREGREIQMEAAVLSHTFSGTPSLKGTQLLDAYIWTRTRRALTILLDRSSLTQGRTANLKLLSN